MNRRHFLRLVGTLAIGIGTGFGIDIDFKSARPKTHLALIVSPVDPRWVLVSSHDEALWWLQRNFTPEDETIEIHDIVGWPFLLQEKDGELKCVLLGPRDGAAKRSGKT